MLLEKVKIGDRLEIRLARDKNSRNCHPSQVENLLPDGQVVVGAPISYGEIIKLPKFERYSLVFFTEKGMIRFDASFVQYVKEDGFYFVVFNLESAGERIQRREFFRFECTLPFRFGAINSLEYDQWELLTDEARLGKLKGFRANAKYEGLIRDIGGGGVRFVSNDELDEIDLTASVIPLNDDLLLAVGKLLAKQTLQKNSYKYQYRIQFTGVTPKEQERIIQFIFMEQRRLLKQGKIGNK
ncbi:MAG: flagellar brake protein [Clostridiales bacterium]|jgi:c-di-GMP-binding flagellar brake protein YcgR|nr:flagellar brake protein [Clostridiales bacterium]